MNESFESATHSRLSMFSYYLFLAILVNVSNIEILHWKTEGDRYCTA
jgi:hypothetical protein